MHEAVLLVRHCLLLAVLILCVYTDLAHRKIYNWCTLPAILLGLLFNYALGGMWDGGWRGAVQSTNLGGAVIAVGIALVIFGFPYLKGGISAGDVKLMLAVAAIGGMRRFFIAHALFYTALLGALMAILALIWRGRLWDGVKGAVKFTFSTKRLSGGDEPQRAPESRITIPYGVAISIGSVLAWFIVEL